MKILVKICGISEPKSLEIVCEEGADFIGFVFFQKSPRNVNLETAKKLRKLVTPTAQCKIVALFVDQDDAFIQNVLEEIDPDFIQLHGNHSLDRVAFIRSEFRKPIIKAHSVFSKDDVQDGLSYLSPGVIADIILFDAKPTQPTVLPGGNGLQFDWRILSAISGKYPFALAGGLNPDNVVQAIHSTGAHMVDVSSGVETAPGQKDPELIRRFIRNAKSVTSNLWKNS